MWHSVWVFIKWHPGPPGGPLILGIKMEKICCIETSTGNQTYCPKLLLSDVRPCAKRRLSWYYPVGFVIDVRRHEFVVVHLEQESTALRDVATSLSFSHFFSLFCQFFPLSHSFCLSRSVKFLNIHWLCVMWSILLMNWLTHFLPLILWQPSPKWRFWMSKNSLDIFPFMKFLHPITPCLFSRLVICGDMKPMSDRCLVPLISMYFGIQKVNSLFVLLSFSGTAWSCLHLGRDLGELLSLFFHNQSTMLALILSPL